MRIMSIMLNSTSCMRHINKAFARYHALTSHANNAMAQDVVSNDCN